jgi:hypothetical protein
MPPPAAHFGDPANEVVCPLKNNDGSSCRKKCTGVGPTPKHVRWHWSRFQCNWACRPVHHDNCLLGQEKKYRSMQEHIRRAHPEHYIPKLPATEESFALMVNSAPHERPPPVSTPITSVSSIPAVPVGKSNLNGAAHLTSPAAPAEYNPIYTNEYAFPPLTRTSGEFRRAPVHSTANSADPLSQLLHARAELPWEQDHVRLSVITNHR